MPEHKVDWYLTNGGVFMTRNERESFQEELSKYCIYTFLPGKHLFFIYYVFEMPLVGTFGRVHNSPLLSKCAILILRKMMWREYYGVENFFHRGQRLATELGIVNRNLARLLNFDKASEQLGIDVEIVHEYYTRTVQYIGEWLKKLLDYLVDLNCIQFRPVKITNHLLYDIYECKRTGDTILKSYLEPHITTEQDLTYYDMASVAGDAEPEHYDREFNKELRKHDIKSIVNGEAIFIANQYECRRFLRQFENRKLNDLRVEISQTLRDMIVSFAEERVKQASSPLPDSYLADFTRLANLTLLLDSPEISFTGKNKDIVEDEVMEDEKQVPDLEDKEISSDKIEE